MKFIYVFLLQIVVFLGVFLTCSIVSAEPGIIDYTDGTSQDIGDLGTSYANSDLNRGLVPCGRNLSGDVNDACSICHLIEGIHGIVKFVVSLIAVTATVVIVIAGVMYIISAGNPAMVTMAKTAMKNALIGVIVVLTAFMMITFIVNTVFNNYNSDLNVREGGLESSGFGRMWSFNCQ